MNRGYYGRIAAYLSMLVLNDDDSPVRPDPVQIREAIAFLIRTGWSAETIRQDALMMYDVIIREDLFPPEERAT